MQKKAIRLIAFSDFDAHTSPLFFELKLLKLQDHIKLQTLYFMHQFFTGKLPKIFDSFFIKTSDKHNVNTRCATRTTFYVPKIRTNYGKFNIRYNGPKLWNETAERFKILTPHLFKKELTKHFIKVLLSFTITVIFWCFCYLFIYLFTYLFLLYYCKFV